MTVETRAQGRGGRFRGRAGATSIGTRLPSAVVAVSLISLVVATLVGVRTGSSLGRDLTDDRLVALRSSAAIDVTGEVRSLARMSDSLASSRQTVIAVQSFAEARDELRSRPIAELEDEVEELVEAYQTRYIEPARASGNDVELRDVVAVDTAALQLQYNYGVDLGVYSQPISIDDARDGSDWSRVHAAVHPVYRDVVTRLELADLYLVDPSDGAIVYSAAKGPDLGTSLDVGPFSGSFLATVVDRVRDDPEGGAKIGDVSFYLPTGLTPVAAAASPVFEGDRLVGVIVLMFDADRLTQILTAQEDWGGFPETGQSYLIGSDGRLLSEPRPYLENREAYLEATVAAGELTPDQANSIRAANTAVLKQSAVDETFGAGEAGDDTVRTRSSLTGEQVFSTVETIEFGDLRWYVATETDVEAAEGDLDEFIDLLVVGTAIFIVGLAFLAVWWASRIVRPIRAISDRLATGSDLGPIEVPPRSPIEFRRLADSFESMSEALRDQRRQLEQARHERLRLLRRMLPPNVADRVARGDVESIEEVPQATVVAVVVLGLGQLVRKEDRAANRMNVDHLLGELDELAARHGLERVKVVGDTYVAACGHARPYIDHAPRAVAFATDAAEVVREAGERADATLATATGVHTGAVTVGVTVATRLLYDVWGPPVVAAHHLARRAARGEILVSGDTRRLLPETTPLVARAAADGQSPEIWAVEVAEANA